METFVKEAGSSSDGTIILVTNNNLYFAFNSEKCKKIVGLNDYLWSYLGNNLRVFTPAKITFWDTTVVVELTLEKVEFVAESCEIPTWFSEGKNIQSLREVKIK